MHHVDVRRRLVDHVDTHWNSTYGAFVDEERTHYVERMRCNGTWGDEPMIAAFAAVYDRTVIVYEPNAATEIARYGSGGRKVVRVTFDGAHYDALY